MQNKIGQPGHPKITAESTKADLAACHRVLKVLDDAGIIGVEDGLLSFLEHAGDSDVVSNLVVRALTAPPAE